jgi:carboxymethylenebutenolidase
MGITGAVSEEQFKAMHELKQGSAPKLYGQMIEIGGSRAFLSLPDGVRPPVPAVVVIHEWWGLNEHIMHWTDRLAALGYAAVAVDLYGGKVATTPDEAMATMKAVDNARALETLLAAHRFLQTDPRIRAERRASIGWCFGGAWSLQYALNAPDLSAAVIYYGRLVSDPAKLSAIRAPLLGIFGNLDEGIPPAAVNEFEAGLKTAGVKHTIVRYEAQHGFANPSGARYDEKSAAAAWEQVKGFLELHLKKGGAPSGG